MRRRLRDARMRRRFGKVKPGDGSSLPPWRWWQPLSRSLFTAELADARGGVEAIAVDVDFFDDDGHVQLYRNGAQTAVSSLPAAFPVPGGHVEVMTSTFGLRRMHLVRADGTASMLTPHPRSAEGLRARLDQKHPVLSRVIGVVAIAVLLVSLALAVPSIVEWVSHLEPVAERFGTFTSPIPMPGWLYITLLVASIVAATERALTLRYHWLIDTDAGMLGG